MKKKNITIIIVIVLMSFNLIGCSNDKNKNEVNWEQIIQEDFFGTDDSDKTILEDAIEKQLTYEVEENKDTLIVRVSAPNICKPLLKWMNNVTDAEFNEKEMEKEMLRLLKKEDDIEAEYVMKYTQEDGENEIFYTEGFSNAMSCGITEFYAELTRQIVDEMESEAE